MSGQYGRAPRALYYFLLIFIVLLQRQNWLVAGAAASCLIIGGSASIHAFILTSILSLGKTSTPNGVVQLPNSTMVTVRALVTDLDSDATLAIVGSGFLIALPMAIWSAEFRRPGIVQILVMWTLLMFAGIICCLINLYAINGSSSGPLRQLRFCTPGYQDTLPYNGDPISVIHGTWNETVWAYFNGDGALTPSCLYPCLNARELLRQPGDAQVVKFPDVRSPDSVYHWTIEIFAAIVYGCVPLSILLGFALVILRLRGDKLTGWASIDPEKPLRRQVPTFLKWTIKIYGYILTPFVFVVFLVWVEWIISFDLQSESMQLVGQWTPLLGAVLVFVAAFIGRLWPERDIRVSGPVP
jgi:hypothetical protein